MGVILLLLMIITAFLGYVLPWGQMSYLSGDSDNEYGIGDTVYRGGGGAMDMGRI